MGELFLIKITSLSVNFPVVPSISHHCVLDFCSRCRPVMHCRRIYFNTWGNCTDLCLSLCSQSSALSSFKLRISIQLCYSSFTNIKQITSLGCFQHRLLLVPMFL